MHQYENMYFQTSATDVTPASFSHGVYGHLQLKSIRLPALLKTLLPVG